MKIELPPEVYKPDRRRPVPRMLLLACALLLALITGWQVFRLPGRMVRRNIVPPDMSGKLYGLRDLWIDAPGNWTITRTGYLDRMEMYKITAGGQLWREREMLSKYEPLDVSGIAHGSPKMLDSGYLLDVKASPRFWQMLRSLRPDSAKPARTMDAASAPKKRDTGFEPPTFDEMATAADAAAVDATDGSKPEPPDELYVPLQIHHITRPGELRRILPGHEHFPSLDSWACVYPDLWLTTDNQHWLHRIRIVEDGDTLAVAPEAMVELDSRRRITRDCVIGLDPRSGRIFILLANGNRLWFDAQTLAPAGEDQLPGVWDYEYGTFAAGALPFVHDQGWALSRTAYRRLMSVLMVIFTASLLAAAIIGRAAWKSTSVATTAASSSKSSSSTT